MRCAIWYNLYYLKSAKNTHGGVLVLVVKLQAKALLLGCFTFFKLYRWYQIAQSITICRAVRSIGNQRNSGNPRKTEQY